MDVRKYLPDQSRLTNSRLSYSPTFAKITRTAEATPEQSQERALVAYLELASGEAVYVVLNSASVAALAAAFGTESENWTNKYVSVRLVDRIMSGERRTIRLVEPATEKAYLEARAASQRGQGEDDEMPF